MLTLYYTNPQPGRGGQTGVVEGEGEGEEALCGAAREKKVADHATPVRVVVVRHCRCVVEP